MVDFERWTITFYTDTLYFVYYMFASFFDAHGLIEKKKKELLTAVCILYKL